MTVSLAAMAAASMSPLLVEADTLATMESLAGILEQARPHTLHKVQRFSELMEQHLDLPVLRSVLD